MQPASPPWMGHHQDRGAAQPAIESSGSSELLLGPVSARILNGILRRPTTFGNCAKPIDRPALMTVHDQKSCCENSAESRSTFMTTSMCRRIKAIPCAPGPRTAHGALYARDATSDNAIGILEMPCGRKEGRKEQKISVCWTECHLAPPPLPPYRTDSILTLYGIHQPRSERSGWPRSVWRTETSAARLYDAYSRRAGRMRCMSWSASAWLVGWSLVGGVGGWELGGGRRSRGWLTLERQMCCLSTTSIGAYAE